jgi:hypothetical protein
MTSNPSAVYLIECQHPGDRAWIPLDDIYERSILAAKVAVKVDRANTGKGWKYRILRYKRGGVVR